jgi:hypothetical protein
VPAIEIACLELDTPEPIPADGFAVMYERGLKSQRIPSRFQGDFSARNGCLYHLGNPSRRDPQRGGQLVAYDALVA